MQAKDILVCRKILTTRVSKGEWKQHVPFRKEGLLQRHLSLTVKEWWELVSHKWHPEESANRGQLLIKIFTLKPDGPNDYCYVTQKPLSQDISRFWLSTAGHPNLAPASRVLEVTFNLNVWQKGALTFKLYICSLKWLTVWSSFCYPKDLEINRWRQSICYLLHAIHGLELNHVVLRHLTRLLLHWKDKQPQELQFCILDLSHEVCQCKPSKICQICLKKYFRINFQTCIKLCTKCLHK